MHDPESFECPTYIFSRLFIFRELYVRGWHEAATDGMALGGPSPFASTFPDPRIENFLLRYLYLFTDPPCLLVVYLVKRRLRFHIQTFQRPVVVSFFTWWWGRTSLSVKQQVPAILGHSPYIEYYVVQIGYRKS